MLSFTAALSLLCALQSMFVIMLFRMRCSSWDDAWWKMIRYSINIQRIKFIIQKSFFYTEFAINYSITAGSVNCLSIVLLTYILQILIIHTTTFEVTLTENKFFTIILRIVSETVNAKTLEILALCRVYMINCLRNFLFQMFQLS